MSDPTADALYADLDARRAQKLGVELGAGGVGHDVDAQRVGLPRDFDRWAADQSGVDDGAAVSDRDYVGPRLQVGVELRLF